MSLQTTMNEDDNYKLEPDKDAKVRHTNRIFLRTGS